MMALKRSFHDRFKATEDHAFGVERRLAAHFRHLRIAHHPFVGGIAGLPVRIFEPGEDRVFAGLRIHGLAEVGQLAFRNICAPSFQLAPDAAFAE